MSIQGCVLDTILEEIYEGPEKSRMYLRKVLRVADVDWSALDVEWKWRICTARLMNGIFDWRGFEFRSLRGGMIPYTLPHWKGEKGKVLIFAEQGIGDEVMFMSCLQDVIDTGADVTVECDKRLQTIFRRSFPSVTFKGREGAYTDPIDHDCDYQIPMGDLLRMFRTSVEDVPGTAYLKADPKLVEKYKEFKGKTGKSWRGRSNECMPNELEGTVNLQYDWWPTEVEDLKTPDFNLKTDIDDLFALISVLKAVNCVPTSLAHFAGALGVKCNVFMNTPRTENMRVNWRFGNKGDSMPWHNSLRIIR